MKNTIELMMTHGCSIIVSKATSNCESKCSECNFTCYDRIGAFMDPAHMVPKEKIVKIVHST